MKKPNILVFDDFVYGVNSNNAVFTDAKFNDLLGKLDQTAIFAVADSTAGSAPALNVQLQQSPDGRNWVNKNTLPEIANQSIPTTVTTPLYGYDSGSAPSGAFGRLAVWLGASSTAAHVKIFVCDRDQL